MAAKREHQSTPSGANNARAIKTHCDMHDLIFTRVGPLRIDLEITNKFGDNSPLYSVDISGLFGDNTEIALYEGSKKDAQILGRSRFNKFHTSEMQIIPKGGASIRMVWVKQHDFYRWAVPKQSQPGDSADGLDQYVLWKASEDPVYSAGNLELRSLQLCDFDGSKVYATYTGAAPGSKKGGSLRVRDDLGKEVTTMIILTLCCLIEKERQKRARKGNFTTGMLAY